MVDRLKFYIDGAWQAPASKKTLPVVNPATEEVLYEVALGSAADVDKAVAAARRAFETFSLTTREQRIELLGKIIEVYKRRMKDIGAAISDEMGAPLGFAERFQAGAGLGHLMTTLDVLKSYPFEERLGSAMIVREPIGVVGMITPWNWPLNQIACKVAPALAAGCTMVLKPSEIHADLRAHLRRDPRRGRRAEGRLQPRSTGWAAEVGAAMSAHPGIDMMSFTGSTRAGIDVVAAVPRRRSSASRRSSAASRRTSSWRMPTCRSRSPAEPRTASTTPASPATRRPACWCRSQR